MKKKILFFFLILALSTSSKIFSQLAEENFEYNVGDPITDHGWVANGNPGTNTILVVAPGLEFPCYAGSGLGNAVALNENGPDAFKLLSREVDSGSIYVSFMVKFSLARTGDYFFHLSDSTTSFNSDIGRVYARDSSGKIALGLGKESNQDDEVVWTPAQYYKDTTYVVVIKYSFILGDQNDLVSLFVFSICPPVIEPPPTLGPIGLGENDLPEVGKVILRQGASSKAPNLIIDGIYASTTWNGGALPVELSSFSANVNRRDATLYWTTVLESNNSGFNVERKLISSTDWTTVGNVTGNGTSNVSHNYTFTDVNLAAGKYNYRLKQIDFNGNFEYHNLNAEIEIGTPGKFDISQNYPNPFNPSTMINYEVSKAGFVSIKVFDNLGREVATLVNDYMGEGYYSIDFNGGNLSSGLYFYKMETAGFSKIMKMTLLK